MNVRTGGDPAADILLIDDDAGFLQVLSRILRGYPHQRFATSGADGLRLVHNAPPDLILLDVEMPDLGGIEFCRQLKAEPRFAGIPVIFVTSHGEISLVSEVFRTGGSDFLTKPVNQYKVLSAVEHFLTGSPHSRAGKDTAAPWPKIEGIDSRILREQIGGDITLFAMLLHKLVDDFADVALIAANTTAETLDGHCTRMHRLKGASGTLGAMELFELASLAETIGGGGDVAEFRRLADAAAAELALLRERIDQADAERLLAGSAERTRGTSFDALALARSLRQQSLASLTAYEEVEEAVEALLGAANAAVLREHLAQLRFACAADMLQMAGRDG
jgi:CheY-like chemotaxis protein/HPt (histidine-containing phosphotransfer) domain-containing protein